ncbi:leucine-rich repeat domain-containing protein [Myxococcota bacterium]
MRGKASTAAHIVSSLRTARPPRLCQSRKQQRVMAGTLLLENTRDLWSIASMAENGTWDAENDAWEFLVCAALHHTRASKPNLQAVLTLKTLDVSDEFGRVTDIEPVRQLSNLRTLVIMSPRVATLDSLVALKLLEELRLVQNVRVRSLEPIGHLTTLRRLVLSNSTRFRDIGPLASLDGLVELELGGTRVIDFSPVAALQELTKLGLHGTKIPNLRPLERLTRLEVLDLGQTAICDLEALAGLTRLKELTISRTKVSDLRPLEKLDNLERLEMVGCSKINSLAALHELPRLMYLSCNIRNRSELERFRQLHPDCTITK